MMVKILKIGIVLTYALTLSGCLSDLQHNDLKSFVSHIKAMPQNSIQPLPPVRTYEPFTYEASGLRSPFEAPRTSNIQTKISSSVKPDVNRKKQFLENLSFDAFKLVGTLQKSQKTKGLLEANQNIYMVSEGDYIGRNHGRITGITEKAVHIVELVPSGVNSWIERPRRLSLK